MSIYRKIYKEHYGPIPLDQDGRKYEIHHIDGNHSNNAIENLKAVTIQEHYDIHYAQGDYGACWLIARKMKLSPKEISSLASLSNKKRIAEGTHIFLDSEFKRKNAIEGMKNGTNPFSKPGFTKAFVENGTHNFLGGEIQRKTQNKRVKEGTHIFLDSEFHKKILKEGKHPTQKEYICPHCGKNGKGATNATRWHFDNCKEKKAQS